MNRVGREAEGFVLFEKEADYQEWIAAGALFIHRILSLDAIVFQYGESFFSSQIGADRSFEAFQKGIAPCAPQEICAAIVSFSPFRVRFSGAQYDGAMNRWHAEHFAAICKEIQNNPRFDVKQVCFLGEEEKELVLNTWNHTQAPFPEEKMLHQLVEERAALHPNWEAVRFNGHSLSYQELNEQANRLAHFLRSQGIGKDVLAALCMERSIQLIVSILAVLKAGGAYVPLDPSYPEERLLYILSGSKSRILICHSQFQSLFHSLDVPTILIDQEKRFTDCSAENPFPVNCADDLCYVIYTSGSTGRPKGVANIHRALVNRIVWMEKRFRLQPSQRVLQKTPFSFDISVWEFFWPLIAGGTLVIAEPGIHRDAEALAELIQKERIALLHFVPSMLELFLEVPSAAQCTSLQKVFTGGEAISQEIVHKFFRMFSCELHNLYGPTEAAIDVTTWAIEPDSHRSLIPIGRPIANTQIYILDEFLHPCPIGAPGELFIGGIGLARGYIHQRELTEEKFIPHPFSPGKKVYRTGDLCRFLHNGTIEYLGRLDRQIKLRGFRIELMEIEAVLRKSPQVGAAAVVAQTDASGQKYLAAYITPQKPELQKELEESLHASLPKYMVPGVFVFLQKMPLTPNGKLDVGKLPLPALSFTEDGTAQSLPSTAWEKALAPLWCAVLGRTQIGVDQGFFSLGGHSLKAMQLVLKIKNILGKQISLPDLFQAPTLRAQALLLETRGSVAEKSVDLIAHAEQLHEPFALTDIQQAYLLGRTDVFSLGSIRSRIYAENHRGALDKERLERALNRLIARHPMLRAVIQEDGSQRILPSVPHYSIQEEAVRETMLARPFFAGQWPLFEIALSKERIHFLFDLLMIDGTGLEVFFEELSLLYETEEANLTPLSISYRDCVLAMEQKDQRKAKEYWFRRIESLPDAPRLPHLPNAKAGPFVRYQGSLCPEKWQEVQKRAAQEGISPAAFLAFLYGMSLKTQSQSAHFTMNVMFFNRPPLHPDVDRIIGNFSTTLLLEMDLREENVKNVQAQLLEDLEYAEFNGIQVLNEKNRRRGGSSAAAMPIVFACALNLRSEEQETKIPRFAWDGKTVPYSFLETPQVLLDHQVFEERDGSFHFHWDVRSGYFIPGVIESCFDYYTAKLNGRETAAPRPFPQTEEAEPLCLHDAFFHQALHRPERTAIITQTRTLSYKELANASLLLSERLSLLDLQPGDPIAIIMEKGWEQAAAVLGIHAAQAAYLPIDAALPEERIKTILSLSGAKAAVVQKPLSFESNIPLFFIEQRDMALYLPPAGDPSQLAYIIFTSGSTGTPKGVMIEHKAAMNTVGSILEKYKIHEEDRCFASASLSFDLSVFDLFGFLRIGASLYLPNAAETPSSWPQILVDQNITVWNSTPALMQLLVEQAELAPKTVYPLRLVMMSGDWIPVPLPDRIKACFRACVYSLGGATEASIWSNDYAIESVDLSWPSIPYGKALARQSMLILDENLEIRPDWAVGHIYIGGAGLARGYLNDAKKTAQSFITHPRTGQRLYRTGDLGRRMSDGNIEFLGREDLQVKVQGYRIELEEIEAAIHRYPKIRQAIVRTVGQKDEAKKIVAFFLAEETVDLVSLETHLSKLLPRYMKPHQFLQLKTFPLSVNGKVDTKALTDMLAHHSSSRSSFDPPRGVLEEKMALLWKDLLSIEKPGRDDNFFSLGGTSFSAFRFVFLAQKELGLLFSAADLFHRGTIAQLCQEPSSVQDPSLVPLQKGGSRAPLFLIHPSGGGVLCYTQLASLLPDRPIYGLQAKGFLDGRECVDSIASMAEHYLSILLKQELRQPVHLGGWSLGGSVAYEMARRLQERGILCAPVVMIDAPLPYPRKEENKKTLREWFEEDYGDSLHSFDASAKETLFSLFCAHLRALQNYEPPSAPIDLLQLKANHVCFAHLQEHPWKREEDWGWGRVSQGIVRSVLLEADHSSILRSPCVEKVAQIIG